MDSVTRIYTLEQLERKLHVSKQTLRKYCKEGKLKASKLMGKTWLVKEQDLNEFLENQNNEKQ